MEDPTLALVKEVHRKEIERLRALDEPKPEPPPVPHTELPELPPDNALYREWNTYRREVGALLAGGCEHGWIVVKGDAVYGLYGSWKLAYIAGLEKALQQELQLPFLIQQVRSTEPVSAIERLRRSCPPSPFPLKKT